MSDRQTTTDGVDDTSNISSNRVVLTDGGDSRADEGDAAAVLNTNRGEQATDGSDDEDEATKEGEGEDQVSVLRARTRRLEEENRRLRDRYAGVRERRYTRTAIGLAAVGIGFGIAGVVVTSAQEVLFGIAAAGLFGAVLTRYLTPEQFIPLEVGEGIYAALADNEAAIADQLGLSSTRVYLATDQGPRLFVPELDGYDRSLLDEDAFDRPLVVNDTASRSGVVLRPTAEPLVRAFEEQHRGDLPQTPRDAVATLREGVTDALELAAGAEVDLDSAEGRVTVSVDTPLYGDVTAFDHPLASFLGSGLATALDTPVEVDVVTTDRDETTTPLVTCRWDPGMLKTADEERPESAEEHDGDESDELPETGPDADGSSD